MNILLVDDEKQENNNWNDFLKATGKEIAQQYKITLLYSENLESAEETIGNSTIDFLIVDTRLGNYGEPDGNELIKTISKYGLRIPTVFFTGTSDDVVCNDLVLKIYKKSEVTVNEVLMFIISVWNTGINDILCKDGFLEDSINKFYKELFIPGVDNWVKRQETDKERVQRSLLKIALNNLNALLEYDDDKAFSEQVYLFFIKTDNVYTGSILKDNESEDSYIVISPSCDIFLRKDEQGNMYRNVDMIHLLRITNNPAGKNSKNSESYRKNNKNRFHFLPSVKEFNGGYIDFADIKVITEESLNRDYEILKIRISEPFMKNISGRFSSYFGRQGQPDLDFEE